MVGTISKQAVQFSLDRQLPYLSVAMVLNSKGIIDLPGNCFKNRDIWTSITGLSRAQPSVIF